MWIARGGDPALRREAVEWFTVVGTGGFDTILFEAMPPAMSDRYFDYVEAVQGTTPDTLVTSLSAIETLDVRTHAQFEGIEEELLLQFSATLSSSLQLWTLPEYWDNGCEPLSSESEEGEEGGEEGGGLDGGEIAESDAKGALVGGLAGAVAGGAWGGGVSLGSLTIPGGIVGTGVGIAAGAAGSSLMEYVEQDAARDALAGHECETPDPRD